MNIWKWEAVYEVCGLFTTENMTHMEYHVAKYSTMARPIIKLQRRHMHDIGSQITDNSIIRSTAFHSNNKETSKPRIMGAFVGNLSVNGISDGFLQNGDHFASSSMY